MNAPALLRAALCPPPPPDLTGEHLGPYEIHGVLGGGGMGVVYEAYDPQVRRKVALKILTEELDARSRLLQEAQITAALEHDNIVPIYEVGQHEGIDYLTMKFVEGRSLDTHALDPKSAAKVARDIAVAVGYANSRGILHRDLKPQNILLDRALKPFVTDFGIAARREPGAGDEIAAGGTPTYMAPELWARKAGATSVAADVWGLGAILYEMLAGHPPFQSRKVEELGRQVMNEPPPPLTGVDRDLEAICLHCLEKDPARRYATATELADDLGRYLKGDEVRARPRSRAFLALRLVARHPIVAALGALLLVAGAYLVVTSLLLARAQQTALLAILPAGALTALLCSALGWVRSRAAAGGRAAV